MLGSNHSGSDTSSPRSDASVVANQLRVQTESGQSGVRQHRCCDVERMSLDVSRPVSVMSRTCCLDLVSAPSCELFLSSYLDEKVLGPCFSWMVSGGPCEPGAVLVVFSETGVDATIVATVLGCTEMGLRVFSSREGSSTEGAVEEKLALEQSSSPEWTCLELPSVPLQFRLPPSAVSAA